MSSGLSNQQFIRQNSSTSTSVNFTDGGTPEPKVERVLRWFEKEGNNLVGEQVLDDVKLEQMQELFEISSENPMYDCYRVESSEQIEYFQKLLNFQLDLQSYEYFVECDAGSNMIQLNPESPISIKYRVCLLINLAGELNKGGYLIVGEFTNNPELVVGDDFRIQNWRVGHVSPQSVGNLTFNFDAKVISIRKILDRHNKELLTEILVESPDKEEIQRLADTLRERNPDVIHYN